MEEHFSRLTPAQLERLACLNEEMHEVGQVIGKIIRHGYESRHPDGGPPNSELLERELGDLLFAMDLMFLKFDVSRSRVWGWKSAKTVKVGRYLHHNEVPKEALP